MTLSQDQYDILYARLSRTEGRRAKPYLDTVGKVTIGIGHNLTDKGIPDTMIEDLFKLDISEALAGAETLPVYDKLDPIRQTVLVDMVFNMGLDEVKQFVNTLAAINRRDYEAAANNMLNSEWARQVGSRAVELANIMRTGSVTVRS
ncbi:MAG: glycoside hydrolase family protein [Patescibacteria group bacterium]|nr:glycoside hydrolase family protein [Patescibacteria group bacterium]